MMHGNRKDLTGQRFGRLVVIEPVTTGEYRNSVWLCQCDCGNKKIVPTYRLLNGRTFSCGCYRKQAKQVIEELAKVKTENERLKTTLKHIEKGRKIKAKKLKKIEEIVTHCIQSGFTDDFIQQIFDLCRENEDIEDV